MFCAFSRKGQVAFAPVFAVREPETHRDQW
jgi:hypothetical protein